MSKLIVIDSGHGGKDGGAVANGFKEKDVVLKDIGLPLSQELKNRGYRVILTRGRDSYLSLQRRANIANNNNADLFISLHLNSFSNSSANGYETYHHPNSKNGKRLAGLIHKRVAPFYRSDRGVKTANFFVLRKTRMPSILLELGFISNINDLNTTLNNKAKIVQEIANAVDEYYGRKPQNADREVFRVRESYSMPDTQKGAYKDLNKAKEVADNTGLNVYNSRGTLVYKPHWATKHFLSLEKKGYKFTDKRFNDNVTRGELFAALDKVLK